MRGKEGEGARKREAMGALGPEWKDRDGESERKRRGRGREEERMRRREKREMRSGHVVCGWSLVGSGGERDDGWSGQRD